MGEVVTVACVSRCGYIFQRVYTRYNSSDIESSSLMTDNEAILLNEPHNCGVCLIAGERKPRFYEWDRTSQKGASQEVRVPSSSKMHGRSGVVYGSRMLV